MLVHHGNTIPQGVARVSLDKALVPSASLPFPEENVVKVGKAEGNFLLWPRRLIRVLSLREGVPKFLRKSLPKEPTLKQPKAPIAIKEAADLQPMPQFVGVMYNWMRTIDPESYYVFAAHQRVFGVERNLIVCWKDFDDFWKFDMIPGTIMGLNQV